MLVLWRWHFHHLLSNDVYSDRTSWKTVVLPLHNLRDVQFSGKQCEKSSCEHEFCHYLLSIDDYSDKLSRKIGKGVSNNWNRSGITSTCVTVTMESVGPGHVRSNPDLPQMHPACSPCFLPSSLPSIPTSTSSRPPLHVAPLPILRNFIHPPTTREFFTISHFHIRFRSRICN